MNDNERHQKIRALFEQAMKLSPDERKALLDKECEGDDELRREVEALLEHNDMATMSFLEPPAPDIGQQLAQKLKDFEKPPEKIGPYRVLETLGEGGMGVVYLCEQTEPVKRRVAIKIIKLGMDSKEVLARFEAERQALAWMDHPGIAKVFDAGISEEGRPYFVMEHVRGVPLTQYCDLNKLDVEERLALFTQVCDAVQHAHQKGVIHRDLKPSNILVTASGKAPRPVVIDFGVAKATAATLTARTLFTQQGQLIGTPEYMSPEQAEMTSQDIDTRSDIYSLGVVLYELLTGSLPFDSRTLREAALFEIQRIIREEEPQKPSTRLSSLGDRSGDIASARRVDTTILSRQLQGDLDWIAMRALEKDRARRYATATELADDINRHLRHEPVLASPPSIVYRTRKFTRRHRGLVASVAIIGLALTAGVIGTTWQARLAIAARDRAEARDEAGRTIARALLGDVHESVVRLDGATDARRSIIDAAGVYLADLERLAEDRPELEREIAEMYERMGDLAGRSRTGNLGDGQGAEDDLARAVELRRSIVRSTKSTSKDHEALASALARLSEVHRDRDELDEALSIGEESLAVRRAILKAAPGSDDAERKVAWSLAVVGAAQFKRGEVDEARASYEESETIRRTRLTRSPDDRDAKDDVCVIALRLAAVASNQKQYDRALELNAEAVRLRTELAAGAPEHEDEAKRELMWALYFRGQSLYFLDRVVDALDDFQRASEFAVTRFELDPTNVQASKDLRNVLSARAMVASKLEDPNRASSESQAISNILQRAVTLAPQDTRLEALAERLSG